MNKLDKKMKTIIVLFIIVLLLGIYLFAVGDIFFLLTILVELILMYVFVRNLEE